MKWIQDRKGAWKWHSVSGSFVGAVISAAGLALKATGAVVPWFSVLPTWQASLIALCLFLFVFIGRFVDQERK